MTVVIKNPRVTATADLHLENDVVLPVTVPRSANREDILLAVRNQVQAESLRRAAVGDPTLAVPTDEQLVTALAAFNSLVDQPFNLD